MADGSEGSGERSAETSSSCQFINRLRIGARCPARSKKRPQTYSDSSTSERSSEGSGSDRSETEKTKVVIPRKHKPKGALFQTTKLVVKRGDQSGSPCGSEQDEDADKLSVVYRSSRTVERAGPADMGATATLDIETEFDRDAQAVFERKLAVNKELTGKADDHVYRGLNAYATYYEKKDTTQGNAAGKFNRQGPIRAPTNIRSTIRWDYQPDICKDYKETGFCGFGDSCKFLHDRSDYKHGWQVDRDLERGAAVSGDDPDQYRIPSSDEDDVPFACIICRQSFKDPVVTRCGHYSCEACALARFKKTARCYACGENTMGIFNPAKNIMKKKAAARAVRPDSPELVVNEVERDS